MKDKNRKNALSSNTLLALLVIATLTTAVTKTAMAKSLYVIADIKGSSEDRAQPVQAYDIGVDGTLIFQAQHDIPHSMLGAVGMAIDSDFGYVFITYEASGEIQLIEATTMADAGTTTAPDALDLAGIVYDHENSLLYTVDRSKNNLYVYHWYPDTATLIHVPGSPFSLQNASAFGIALDEIDDLLYVANASNTVTVYRTSDWRLVDTISLSRIAISIAVDVTNGFVYTGGGFAGNMFLTQYHLATGTEAEVQVEPDAGVMGLGVDTDTGLVYMSTGSNNAPGGDNLLVYDAALNQIDIITAIGNPAGLAIPGKDIGYNPLNLNKHVLRGAGVSVDFGDMKTVGAGDTYTYGVSFENSNDFTVTDVTIVDKLPDEVTFVSADDDGVNGFYDYDDKTKRQTYIWTYQELPPRTSTLLELTVQAHPDIDAGTIITNSVTINSNETAPTTTSVDVITTSNALNLKKGIFGTPEGQITQVNTGDIITYTIEFDNKDNDFPVTNVIIVDELPKDVNIIDPDDKNYDAKSHTYTWTFDSLEPGAVMQLELVVSVNPDLPLGSTITNIVTIDSDETPKSSTSVDAMTYYEPLNIDKKGVDMSGSVIGRVNPGDRFAYQICFDNNNNDSKVTEVVITDELPDEVTFVEDVNANGKYDEKNHTYTWSYGTLAPGLSECFELVVDVNENITLGTVIANSVTIDSNETLPATADVNIDTKPLSMSITPNVLRRNGTSPNIMAVVQLSKEDANDINPNDQPELLYRNQNGKFVSAEPPIRGDRSYPTGTGDSPTITVYFSRPQLMNALYGYGEFTLRVKGTLGTPKTSRTYVGEAIIHITRFAGD